MVLAGEARQGGEDGENVQMGFFFTLHNVTQHAKPLRDGERTRLVHTQLAWPCVDTCTHTNTEVTEKYVHILLCSKQPKTSKHVIETVQ